MRVARQQRDEQPGRRQQQQHGEVHAQTDVPGGDVGPLAREKEIVAVGGVVPQSRPVGQRAFRAFLAPGRGQQRHGGLDGVDTGALFNIRCGIHFLFLVPAANTTEGWGVMVTRRDWPLRRGVPYLLPGRQRERPHPRCGEGFNRALVVDRKRAAVAPDKTHTTTPTTQ